MLKKISGSDSGEISTPVNSSPESDPIHIHWTIHLLLLATCIFLLVALLFNVELAERWFSPDRHISDSGHEYLKLLRYLLLIPAGVCVLIWALRKIIISDLREAVERWRKSPSRLEISSVVPSMQPVGFQRVLWLILFLWTVGAVILIYVYRDYANLLTHEGGLFETLTVVFYIFAGLIALRLAIPYLLRNSPNGLLRWWLLGLAAGCIFVAGEEINWGELYFHYEAGEFIRRGNYQREISLHNVALPYIGSYFWNALLKFLTICGGVLLPLLIWTSKSFRRLVWAVQMPLPPWLSQAYFFATTIFIYIFPRDLIEKILPRPNIPVELREFTISVGVAIWLWCFMKNQRNAHT